MPLEWLRDDSGRGVFGVDWPRALLAALTSAIVVALGVSAVTSTAAFGPYNPSWDGIAEFREGAESDRSVESELLLEAGHYDEFDAAEATGTVAFVIAPEEPYDETDAAHVRRFVESGGTLVLLENFGPIGNALLSDVGAEARVSGALLRDERHNHRSPTMPVATGVANHTLTDGIDRLTLNHASRVDPGDDATVLVSTSSLAYVDDGDGGIGDEGVGSHPVVTVEDVGDGQVIVGGDPSIAINVMVDEPDNGAFLSGLYDGHDRILFDHSHTGDIPPLTGVLVTIRGSQTGQAILGLLSIGTVGALSTGRVRPILGRVRDRAGSRIDTNRSVSSERGDTTSDDSPVLSRDERAEFLRRRHPEWDDERIQRVITAGANDRGDSQTVTTNE